MGSKRTEACGRCSMSTVVDVASSDEDDGDDARDPFGEDAIEVDDETLRRVSPGAWIGRVTDRIDDLGHRLIYGR
ncbi:hypothetical protein C488_02605 [Natrinema pellirubrum DSM 15624]|uniref:Uncharacterized protein n=1 Tax=Natrinema pellirubrum (strain DSM 15624 / CIP 106293 / JCM 10476 / NCIMB 786 / 157) TaxID=797303 RepID=L0JI45_NATP1|nr:hypothetical protein [Natrinema pellirubrum]AGB30974.1 hypothetical protein Natpe_1062 [Natrinema pellirubrum DSM 15624]ELY80643.1 hypothetical protein C488_02605 [Natrinema pellirubrum DSM 15624]ELZ12380.1 hypothetical protein C478_09901 [Natrinema thermotolerans DSM 11552]